MKRILYLIILCTFSTLAQAQLTFQGTSLSEALIELDKSSKHYDISFVYDELEDFTVTKTVKRGRSLPDAVREVCGFYPVRIKVTGTQEPTLLCKISQKYLGVSEIVRTFA